MRDLKIPKSEHEFCTLPLHILKLSCMGVGYLFIRKITAAAAALVIVIFTGCSAAEKEAAAVISDEYDRIIDSAGSAIVFCPDSGEVIYGHNIREKRAIASITKILTAVIALEYSEKNDKAVTVTEQMYAEGSSMYLKSGEVLRLSSIVEGMMAVSGNDAANAVALTVGGSIEGFAEIMNRKAALIGMKDSSFCTPSGLDAEEHYSTAYDMALLCAYAMKNSRFAEIVSKKSVTVGYIEPAGKTQELYNHNKLLSICDGCIGIKTGYTQKAGRTLTSCVKRNGMTLICVTLNDGNDWQDHIRLYDYCFEKVTAVTVPDSPISIPVVGEENGKVTAEAEDTVMLTVKKGSEDRIKVIYCAPPFLYSPVKSGDEAGWTEIYMDERLLARKRLVIR